MILARQPVSAWGTQPHAVPRAGSSSAVVARAVQPPQQQQPSAAQQQCPAGRRELLGMVLLAGALVQAAPAQAAITLSADYKKELARRRRKVPIEEFSDGIDGLKYYDVVVGEGPEPVVGSRVAVHFDVKFRNVTFATSRQGAGVTGGTPVGFDVGTEAGKAGSILPGIDKGVLGMRVGGLRRLIVPPELAYGGAQVGEIPPNATLQVDVELLSIKQGVFGTRTKLVEG